MQGLNDSETFGIGVRVLVDGAWGFAAGRELTREEVARLVKAPSRRRRRIAARSCARCVLAPVTATPKGEWRTPIEIDPFGVAIEDKVALLLAANEAALKVQGARFVTSGMFFLREQKTLATTDGTFIAQTSTARSPR